MSKKQAFFALILPIITGLTGAALLFTAWHLSWNSGFWENMFRPSLIIVGASILYLIGGVLYLLGRD